jgi:hypothetical protein
MIWLTWRQFRVRAVTATAALAAFAALLGATGPHLVSLYDASGLNGCQGASNCQHLADNFLLQLYGSYGVLYSLAVAAILLAPAIIGLFWGAPLIAAELETGTTALAWNQSITRTRWLTIKLAITGLSAMTVTEALSLMQAWWAAPIGRAVGYGGNDGTVALGRWNAFVFASHGITPLGYAAFAFTLGVTAGALTRRTTSAMAVTVAIFALVQIAMPLWIRPHLFPPSHTVVSVTSLQRISMSQQGGRFGYDKFTIEALSLPGQPGAWPIASGAVNPAGQPVGLAPAACSTQAIMVSPSFLTCLASHGIREAITYQPASRYWVIQWIETGGFLAVALALVGYCYRRLARRQA